MRELIVLLNFGIGEVAFFFKTSVCSNERAVKEGLVHAICGLAQRGECDQTWVRLHLVSLWHKAESPVEGRSLGGLFFLGFWEEG
jgi:hypothetical protein